MKNKSESIFKKSPNIALCAVKIWRILANARSLKSSCTETGRQNGKRRQRAAGKRASQPHLYSPPSNSLQFIYIYFHSNSRRAIRSIFDIGTWLWRRSCDFSLNRLHDKKKRLADSPPSYFALAVGFLSINLPTQKLSFLSLPLSLSISLSNLFNSISSLPCWHQEDTQACTGNAIAA